MEIIMLVLLILGIILMAVLLVRIATLSKQSPKTDLDENFNRLQNDFQGALSNLRQELGTSTHQTVQTLGRTISDNQTQTIQTLSKTLTDNQSQFSESQQNNMQLLRTSIHDQMQQFEGRLQTLETTNQQKLEDMRHTMAQQMAQMQQDNAQKLEMSTQTLSKTLTDNQSRFSAAQRDSMQTLSTSIQAQMQQFEGRLQTLETTNQQKLEDMRQTMAQQMTQMQQDNAQKLDHIRTTVDEKLQKTLEEKMTHSFQLVSQRLEEVYKGLGEMQNLANGVGDLKKVLSNVKTRGILGEIQLGAILQEILSPEQYETEIPTIPGSRDHVEFAVKLPAAEDGGYIYLPIDSKFPGDTFATLQDAYDSGSADTIKAARKQLESVIKKCAKDIRDKYIAPPDTTNFAIMFLPFEGLYAEVVNMGLVTDLQRDYHVNIAGPSTMAAMLNSLQMGFQTLQIQKRSNEVWQVLGAVKTEFEKFDGVLDSARKRIRQLDDDLDKLVGVRTRGINRRLRAVQQLDTATAEKVLGNLNDGEEE